METLMPKFIKSCFKSTFHTRVLAAIGVLPLALYGTAVRAQTVTVEQAQPQVQVQAVEQSEDHVSIGIGGGYIPAYAGADKYRAIPIPAIDVKWGRLYANLYNGIGVDVVGTEHVTVGAGITIMPGYRRQDAPRGIGSLSDAAGGRVFVALKEDGLIATLGATQGFSGGTKGLAANASLIYPVVVTQRLVLIPSIATTWANAKYNNRFYGVDTEQSLASGLPQFRPGSGFKDASFFVTASYSLTDRVNLNVLGGVTTVLGDVANSPLVFHKTQPLGFVSLSYRFAP